MRFVLVVSALLAAASWSVSTFADCPVDPWTDARALVKQGKWAEARPKLEAAIAADVNNAEAYFQLGETALRLGDEQTALQVYTQAATRAPTEAIYYGALADLYYRLGFDALAERTVVTGETRASDETKKFALYTLHGTMLTNRGDVVGALTQYERAKKACGQCYESGQQVAFFNLGAAYATQKPPRKSEALLNLQSFNKMICKGASASRYATECAQAQELASRISGP